MHEEGRSGTWAGASRPADGKLGLSQEYLATQAGVSVQAAV